MGIETFFSGFNSLIFVFQTNWIFGLFKIKWNEWNETLQLPWSRLTNIITLTDSLNNKKLVIMLLLLRGWIENQENKVKSTKIFLFFDLALYISSNTSVLIKHSWRSSKCENYWAPRCLLDLGTDESSKIPNQENKPGRAVICNHNEFEP